MDRIVCILGATGTGKTAAGVELALALGGGVVNVDARQVYKGLPIVTAQPEAEEMRSVPHLLYGFVEPSQAVSAGEFADLAHGAIRELRDQGLVPILVGGTGMYVDSIIAPLAAIPKVPVDIRAAWQAKADEVGPEALHTELSRTDPDYASKIHPRDRQRITRALEVFEATGRTFSQWHAQPSTPRYNALKFGLHMPREELAVRLEKRIEAMLDNGALEEVRTAFEACPDAEAPAFTGIGCRELIGVLRGGLSMDEARQQWLKRTKDYAKRQKTWFKRDPDVLWVAPGEHRRMAQVAGEFLRQALPSPGSAG